MENEITESEKNLEVAEQEVVENTADVVEETTQIKEETDISNDETSQEKVSEETEKPQQSEEDNSAARKARIQAQKEAEKLIKKAREEAYEKGLREGKINTYINKLNPYTQKIIKDEVDVQEYLDMYEIDEKGGDPIKDYNEKQKEKAREEAKNQLKVEEENKKQEFYNNDVNQFAEEYPEVNLKELFENKKFQIFVKGKLGNQPLTDIYSDFIDIVGNFKNEAINTAKKIVANNIATPGSVNNSEPTELNWENMSKEKFAEYVQKAKDGEMR